MYYYQKWKKYSFEYNYLNYIRKNIKENPNIQLKDLAALLDISIDGVRWHLTKLKKEGVIKREGSSRNGKWVVVEG